MSQPVTDSANPAAWAPATVQSLGRVLELPPGWDSYGAPAIQPAFAARALDLMVAVLPDDAPAPAVVPTSRGGLQLEWHTRGIDLEIEFETPHRLRGYFHDHQTHTSWEKDLSADHSALLEAIAILSQRS